MMLDLNERAQNILKLIAQGYIETGHAMGSSTLAQILEGSLSSATIRNTMSDLEHMGLLYSPHTSAGRLPTVQGLQVFVEGLLETSPITHEDRKHINTIQDQKNTTLQKRLEQASETLSGLSSCAGLVMTPKWDKALKQVQFVAIGNKRILAILSADNGSVENRILEVEDDITASALIQASNYINTHLQGQKLSEALKQIECEIKNHKTHLDSLTQSVVERGLAVWSDVDGGHLIIKGQSNLLKDIKAVEDLEKIRHIMNALETRKNLATLLEETDQAEGVKIFIGSENSLFNLSGCSMIVAPYKDTNNEIIGALGVIGPSRLNYSRIIPVVDYTSQLLTKLVG